MGCEVEYTDEFGEWWDSLDGDEQESIRAYVTLLQDKGTQLGYPYCSGVLLADRLYDIHLKTLREERYDG